MQLAASPESTPEVEEPIRYPDDVPIVAFALEVGADVLISGDRDLLDVASALPLQVLSPREFFER